MKRTCYIMLIGAFLLAAGSLFAQKISSGDLKVLKGQSTVSLTYDFSHMKVGKYDNEEDYIKAGTAERNKKKAGSGDEWATKWASDKADRFEPMFMKSFNAIGDKCGLTGKQDFTEAKYTLVIHTVYLEQGFQSGVGPSKSAYINLVVDLVETANPGTVLATIEYPKVPSVNMMGYDYDTGERIKSCYDRAGENIAALICKTLKK
ncbi:MAG TPA: hypothetical protein VMC08_06290 [Bacteroidales bacterium]|nr:hypothetical protein [Bacteroidales bacterium]